MAEEKKTTATKKRQVKSQPDRAVELLDEAIIILDELGGDIWPVVVSRLAAVRHQVKRYAKEV